MFPGITKMYKTKDKAQVFFNNSNNSDSDQKKVIFEINFKPDSKCRPLDSRQILGTNHEAYLESENLCDGIM